MSACLLCGAATQSLAANRLCHLCDVRWQDSLEFKRAAYFTKLKREGPAAVAFADFVFGKQKERQADEAEAKSPEHKAKREAAEAKWEAEKKNGVPAPKPSKPNGV